MWSNGIPLAARPQAAMSSFQYRPTNIVPLEAPESDVSVELAELEVTLTERDLSERLASAHAAGFADAEAKMRRECEIRSKREADGISQAIAGFNIAQKDYFARVEAEVVQLALAIAGKILHRDAQVDPMLVAAIVHLALEQLKEGSAATVRVPPEDLTKWREHLASQISGLSVKVVEGVDLDAGDCVLETELGTVNFGLDAQLKEVERGFFDVLAQRPKV